MNLHHEKIYKMAQDLFLKIDSKFEKVENSLLKQEILSAALWITNSIVTWNSDIDRERMIEILYVAKWKNARVKSMLHFAMTLDYISIQEYQELAHDIWVLWSMLYSFIKFQEN